MKPKFEVQFMQEAENFLSKLDNKATEKILFNIHKARMTNDKELFKKLTGDIWEFRTLFNKTHYRLFAFWDKRGETVVICTHGIIKKTAKTPLNELKKAENLYKQYFE